jgi:DMSO/TMAO reductase YedYZ molybdopterin-dependent catalytic subunit
MVGHPKRRHEMRVRLGWMALATAACAALAVAWGAPSASVAAAMAAQQKSTPVPSVSATTLPALPTSAVPSTMAPTTSTPAPSGIVAPPGTLIQVTGAVASPIVLSLKDLQAMPRTTLTMRVLDPDGKRRLHVFSGPLIGDVISQAKPTTSTGVDMATHAYALVTGMTGASAIIAFAEFHRDYNAKRIILAYEEDGGPLPGSGIAQLIVPEDATPGRSIMGVTTIEIMTP